MSKARENEVTFYCKLGSTAGLEKAASVEEQEQWEVSLQSGSRMRVRKTSIQEAVGYTQTIKQKSDGENLHSCVETNQDISEEFYKTFVSAVSEKGCKKRRYTFVVSDCTVNVSGEALSAPDQRIEVDLFYLPSGKLSDWVKIDIELDAMVEFMKSHVPGVGSYKLKVDLTSLPLQLTDTIDSSDPESKDLVSKFWEIHNIKPGATDAGGTE